MTEPTSTSHACVELSGAHLDREGKAWATWRVVKTTTWHQEAPSECPDCGAPLDFPAGE